jgi:hypothetical protein
MTRAGEFKVRESSQGAELQRGMKRPRLFISGVCDSL